MFGGLLLIACVVLRFHYHDSIPWYIWAVAVIAQCVAFGEPSMRSAAEEELKYMKIRADDSLFSIRPESVFAPNQSS